MGQACTNCRFSKWPVRQISLCVQYRSIEDLSLTLVLYTFYFVICSRPIRNVNNHTFQFDLKLSFFLEIGRLVYSCIDLYDPGMHVYLVICIIN